MPTYKTPDVYVEEIPTLPRSVAEVETAVPAFIGYTERVTYNSQNLTLVPTVVRSLLELEAMFGAGPVTNVTSLKLDTALNVAGATFNNNYYMFESLRLFFKNGGGRAYIVSVGTYRTDGLVRGQDLDAGLSAVRRVDEPTLLLSPDAVSLSGTGLYDLQQSMLQQCAELQDRFSIFDLQERDGWQAGVNEFRTRIGVNNLTYGAAYTPWLESSLPRDISYREIRAQISNIRNMAEAEIRLTFDNADRAITDVDTMRTSQTGFLAAHSALRAVAPVAGSLDELYETLRARFLNEINAGAPNLLNAQNAFANLFEMIYRANLALTDHWALAASGLSVYPPPADPAAAPVRTIRQVTTDKITTVLRDTFANLNAIANGADAATGTATLVAMFGAGALAGTAPEWTTSFTVAGLPALPLGLFTVPANDADRLNNMRRAEPRITSRFYELASAAGSILQAALAQEASFESALLDQYPLYANIVRGAGSLLQLVPPSGAIAGIYSWVDQSRGVWKAPANVSLDAVADLTEMIDSDEQKDLNVDTTAGKSINAIRPFTGRGILVWGARTLAGNDNEWRYISVRRFFIMVEESLRKSTQWAVFEPNDANLWIKVKAMIENYLILKWRDGALVGAKPEHAFFVNVGIGVTMTAQDILEAKLIVEIGMAVVRPAEFIILRFSHKMQQS